MPALPAERLDQPRAKLGLHDRRRAGRRGDEHVLRQAERVGTHLTLTGGPMLEFLNVRRAADALVIVDRRSGGGRR